MHNGEINTIRGNADKMAAREERMASEYMESDMHKVLPVINAKGSDSAMLDNTLEFLTMNGHGPAAGSHDYDSGAMDEQPCNVSEKA